MTYKTERKTRILEFFDAHRDRSYTAMEVAKELDCAVSSVYRIIGTLTEDGTLSLDKNDADGTMRYRYTAAGCKHHLHLKCCTCKRLFHLGSEASHLVSEIVFRENGFKIDGSVILLGECSSCQKTGELL